MARCIPQLMLVSILCTAGRAVFAMDLPVQIQCAAVEDASDGGYLTNAASVLNHTVVAVLCHKTTDAALNNVAQCTQAMTGSRALDIAIVGHGATGIVYTGCGAKCGTPQQEMFMGFLARLGLRDVGVTLNSVTLLSCDVGGGVYGSQFLSYLASTVFHCAVWALDGLIYCDGSTFYWDDGIEWRKALPDGRIATGQVRRRPFLARSRPGVLELRTAKAYKKIRFASATDVEVWARSLTHGMGDGGGVAGSSWIQVKEPSKLLAAAGLGQHRRLMGEVGGILVGVMRVRVKMPDGEWEAHEYEVYNDELLVDKLYRDAGYVTSDGFARVFEVATGVADR